MRKFKLDRDTTYAIELKGLAVSNTRMKVNCSVEYPEAAVWLILANEHKWENGLKILAAILGTGETKTTKYIDQCIRHWEELSLIEPNG